MSNYRIHRYIFKETAIPMLLGLTIFTFVLLMGRILKLVEMVINKGVPAGEILLLFLYLLPSFFIITIPLAFLLGTLLGFGRLSSDSEIVALKSCGFSLSTMLRPVLVLALLTSIITAGLTLYALPRGNHAFRTQIFNIINNQATLALQPRVFNDDFDGLVLYTNDMDERSGSLYGIFISDERLNKTTSTIIASEGKVLSDPRTLSLTLRLKNGSIHRRTNTQDKEGYQVIRFDTYDINLNMGRQLDSSANAPRKKKDREMTLSELRQAAKSADDVRDRNRYLVEWHYRLSLPFAPLLFALIGVPLGIHQNRSGKGGGFTLALAVSMAYYFLLTTAKTLGEEGIVMPAIALWMPDLIFLAGGMAVFHLANQEKRIAPLDWIESVFNTLKALLMRHPRR